MKLRAKIHSKYLDKILRFEKSIEFRQFEDLTLYDEKGRIYSFKIQRIRLIEDPDMRDMVEEMYDDVPWDQKLPIWMIDLNLDTMKRIEDPTKR